MENNYETLRMPALARERGLLKKLRESEKALKLLEPRVPKDPISGAPLKQHPPNKNKRIEAKIAEINKKIRRVKNRRNKERLIAKRNSLR